MDIRKMKMTAPQKRGRVRSGADANYIPGVGSQPNTGQHGRATGPYRMVPSSPSPLGPAPSNKPMGHKPSKNTTSESAPLMERYNKEWQRSRERGETVPKNLYGKKSESPLVKAALSSHNSAPYGRNRPASSSCSYATSQPGGVVPNPGAGRARGMNIWYPNMGIDASGDSGDSQDSGECESDGTLNNDPGSTPGKNPMARDGRRGRSSSGG